MFEALYDSIMLTIELIFKRPIADWTGDRTPWYQGFMQAWFIAVLAVTYERIRCWWKCRKLKREIARLQALIPASVPPP